MLRREGDTLRRYVHIGTGNYNAATARQYTDLGLLSADPELGADIHDFFNELTGSSHPPAGSYRRIGVAPTHLLPWLLDSIENEAALARAGRSSRIRVVSILGRYLEHARIYQFGNGGDERFYIGSADWRPRNLRRRVEVVAPVQAEEARARLRTILDLDLSDEKAWELRPDGRYERAASESTSDPAPKVT